MSTLLFSKTPTVTVLDNRALAVREIAYHRHPDSPDATDERITRHLYDARGFLAQSADPRLHDAGLTNFSYLTDLAGNVLRTQGADNGTTVSLNDIAGRSFLAVTPIVTRTWQYEDAKRPGRPLSVTEQVTGETARIMERFVYAENSAEEKALNLAGQCVSHYDTAGLVQTDSVALTDTPLSVTRRLLKDAENPDTVADWQGGDASVWNDWLSGEVYITLTTSDATARVLTTTDARGNVQRVAYDVAGRLSGSWLTLNGGTEQAIVKSLTWSAAGQKLREEHGNGVVTTYEYEPETQRLTGMKTERPADAKVLQDLRYEYDPVGNVLQISNDAEETRFWRNQKAVPENTYLYDSLYQLVSATGREMAGMTQQSSNLPSAIIPLPTDNASWTNYVRTYTYDAAGNLARIRHTPATGSGYTTDITVSDRSNKAVLSTLTTKPAEVDALFTAGGQQKQLLQGQTLQWTPRNELLKVTPVVRDGSVDDSESYRYDNGGQRVLKVSVQKTSNSMQTQRVMYLPGLEVRTTTLGTAEKESLQVITVGEAGRAQVRALHWESGRPDNISNDGLRYSYNTLTGSGILELDGDGNVISMEEYYPYGGTAVLSARSQTEVDYKTIRYSGKERDATGLYYYGFRYYQPWAGRWLCADPAGTVDGLNLFRMVRNNPVTLEDKDGRAPVEHHAAPAETPLADIFQWGDIVYGLDKPREQALSTLSAAGFKRKEVLKPPTKNIFKSIRQSFRKVKEKANITIQNDITNAVWDVAKPKEYSDDKTIRKQLNDPERAIQFREFIASHDKYNVITQEESTKLMAEPWKAMQLGVPLWKRTSKAGLAFQLLVKQKPLHFMTDIIGDDISLVISKEGHGASITSSELRWLYRHRDLPEVQSNLIFYRNGKKISHDDVFGKKEWINYHPKNQYKPGQK
ncbi:insecticidal toxin complex protein TccC [Enterobacter sp. BIGb0383]|uniref:RHS repeat-associated core domain-containing protein n=1 Tax=unclassified Enterobacter TaxID=2608935 RepID=UPI000F478DE7|nr:MULTISPECIES: RHS repeat-associated core domain-containing protein [unclassified Enterobacter]ROP61775.1 insecticidal toxin complex protein TccC [Enterobacter sp. BIGb0383]ROS11936.1 insecticidal toxin complex protein TccC [Enterobacter sp. BIGb0359]